MLDLGNLYFCRRAGSGSKDQLKVSFAEKVLDLPIRYYVCVFHHGLSVDVVYLGILMHGHTKVQPDCHVFFVRLDIPFTFFTV